MKEFASAVVMVEPTGIAANPETATSNVFQASLSVTSVAGRENAMRQFSMLAEKLENAGIIAHVFSGPESCPDAVFPNNWFSTEESGQLILFPMLAKSRRKERVLADEIADRLQPKEIVDLTGYETKNQFLEGTGSMVLDRRNKVAFACESPRTSEVPFHDFCERFGYSPFLFRATDPQGVPIYHTNVMMSIGSDFVVLCDDAMESGHAEKIVSKCEREPLIITFAQLANFCGNCQQLSKDIFVMSQTAVESMTSSQIKFLERRCNLLVSDVSVMERLGGGGIRCMLAEVFI